jgi:hypothetical protein
MNFPTGRIFFLLPKAHAQRELPRVVAWVNMPLICVRGIVSGMVLQYGA